MGCCCFQKLTFGQRTFFPSRRSIRTDFCCRSLVIKGWLYRVICFCSWKIRYRSHWICLAWSIRRICKYNSITIIAAIFFLSFILKTSLKFFIAFIIRQTQYSRPKVCILKKPSLSKVKDNFYTCYDKYYSTLKTFESIFFLHKMINSAQNYTSVDRNSRICQSFELCFLMLISCRCSLAL